MATTYVASTEPVKANISETTLVYSYELTGALVINDIIQFPVPAGATITDVTLAVPDLDSNGTPLVSLSLGDGGDPDRFILSSTIGRTGGMARLDNYVGVNYNYAAADTIDLLVVAAPATSATTGTIQLSIDLVMGV